MLVTLRALLDLVFDLFRARQSLHLEVLALRHQLAVYQRTVARPRTRRGDRILWSFLREHLDELIAVDFFSVPTVRNRVLYVFLVLSLKRRRILHFNITENPTAAWTGQQIVEAFAWEKAPRFLQRDRDRIYGEVFRARVRGLGLEEILSAPRSGLDMDSPYGPAGPESSRRSDR